MATETTGLHGHRVRAPRHARAAPGPRGRRRLLETMMDAVFIVVCVLIFGLFVRTFVAQLYTVPSSSMEDTLQIGDTVVVNRLAPRLMKLRRGDIVVFRDPGGWLAPQDGEDTAVKSALVFIGLFPRDSGRHLVKRVIGAAGDTVACDGRGALTVNGLRPHEPYVHPGDRPCDERFQVTVPPGRIWVLGDHRENSADSRYHLDIDDGAVPVRNVVGRVGAIWSADGPHLP